MFVPVDFATQDLAARLDAARFDWSQRTLFSWVGTTMYLEVNAIAATLRLVARCGLTVSEHPTTDELKARYCARRADGMRPFTTERLLSVSV